MFWRLCFPRIVLKKTIPRSELIVKLPEELEVLWVGPAGVGKHPATWVIAPEKIWLSRLPTWNGGANHLLYVAKNSNTTVWVFAYPPKKHYYLHVRPYTTQGSIWPVKKQLGVFVARFFNVETGSGKVFYGFPSWRRWRLGWGRMVDLEKDLWQKKHLCTKTRKLGVTG